jgi:hypothetical protein
LDLQLRKDRAMTSPTRRALHRIGRPRTVSFAENEPARFLELLPQQTFSVSAHDGTVPVRVVRAEASDSQETPERCDTRAVNQGVPADAGITKTAFPANVQGSSEASAVPPSV